MQTSRWQAGRVIVAVFGAAGAGKTTIARHLVERLGAGCACRISGDHFLQPADGSLDEYFARPVRYDWLALRAALAVDEGEPIAVPGFDFSAFQRVAARPDQSTFARCLIVVDAIAPYPWADLRVLVTAALGVRRKRVAARDAQRGSRVLDQWQQLEQTRRTLRGLARDLALSGERPPDANVDVIFALLRQRGPLTQPQSADKGPSARPALPSSSPFPSGRGKGVGG